MILRRLWVCSLISILFLVDPLIVSGQSASKLSILILSPAQVTYDSLLRKEIQSFDERMDIQPSEELEFLNSLKKEPKNIQAMEKAEFEFRKELNFGKSFTLGLTGWLTYKIFEHTNKTTILPSVDTSGKDLARLAMIAKKNEVAYIIIPLSFHSSIQNKKKLTTVQLLVYDDAKQKIIFEKEYTGDAQNPGFEFTCEEGSLTCTINNIIKNCWIDLLSVMTSY